MLLVLLVLLILLAPLALRATRALFVAQLCLICLFLPAGLLLKLGPGEDMRVSAHAAVHIAIKAPVSPAMMMFAFRWTSSLDEG